MSRSGRCSACGGFAVSRFCALCKGDQYAPEMVNKFDGVHTVMVVDIGNAPAEAGLAALSASGLLRCGTCAESPCKCPGVRARLPFECRYITDDLETLRKRQRRGWLSVTVLPELTGAHLDEVALGFIHGLNPKGVRLCRHGQNDDAHTGRASVHVDDDNRILRVELEVEVALPEGVQHGHALKMALEKSKVRP